MHSLVLGISEMVPLPLGTLEILIETYHAYQMQFCSPAHYVISCTLVDGYTIGSHIIIAIFFVAADNIIAGIPSHLTTQHLIRCTYRVELFTNLVTDWVGDLHCVKLTRTSLICTYDTVKAYDCACYHCDKQYPLIGS